MLMDGDGLEDIYLHRELKKWFFIIIPAVFVIQIFHYIVAGSFSGIPNLDLVSTSYILNWVGSVFGVSSLVLGIGRCLPIPPVLQLSALILGVCYALLVVEPLGGPTVIFGLVVGPLGVVTIVWATIDGGLFCKKRSLGLKVWVLNFLFLSAIITSMGLATGGALSLNLYLLPSVLDYDLFRIDQAFGNYSVMSAIYFDRLFPFFQTITWVVYGVLALVLIMMIGLAAREGKLIKYNVLRTFVLPFAIGFLCYALIPISGPAYAFSGGYFPYNMPPLEATPSGYTVITSFYRNGMPSMHFSGAIFILMLAAFLRNKIYFYCSIGFLIVTSWATMALGEHYLIDLIVAMPFSISLGVVLINPPELKKVAGISRALVAVNVSTFILWMVLFLTAREFLINNGTIVLALSAFSVIVSISLLVLYVVHVWKEEVVAVKDRIMIDKKNIKTRWITIVFFFSGMAGLLYEVVYAKSLGITFGSTSLASYTVLTIYMGGMACGAWLGGYIADRIKNPLMFYAFCEVAIGVYALLTPQLFDIIQSCYLYFAKDSAPDASILTFYRVFLGSLVLAIPTLLMGTTLPIMFKYLSNTGQSSQKVISRLYGANILGAAMGSLLGGYVLLPLLGRTGGTYLAAVASLMIALYVLDKIKQLPKEVSNPIKEPGSRNSNACVGRSLGIVAIIVLSIGGFVTLALEIISMHMLAVAAGNSVYAFGLMLGTFLIGLGSGSSFGEKLATSVSRVNIIVLAQSGVALSIVLTGFLWDRIPGYFGSFYYYSSNIVLDFWGRELVRALVCFIAMFPAAFFIGLSYPASMSLASDWLAPQGEAKGVGISSGLNTLGNITGVIVGGFLLLPNFGSNTAFFILAIVSISLALMACLAGFYEKFRLGLKLSWNVVPVFVATLLIFIYPKEWNLRSLSSGSNVYFMPSDKGPVLDFSESVDGGITSVVGEEGGLITLLTNGKFQGNNAPDGEMVAQESFALIPMLHTSSRNNALVIGYGTGMSASVLYDQGFKKLDIVELSKDIVSLADKYFHELNRRISSQSEVNMIYTDGRNYLLTQDESYDLISMEITSIWFAGAANLYNKEFYSIAKKRLTREGVLQQWVQLHHMQPLDLIYIVNTVRSEFKYVWIYFSGGQGIIVASNSDESLNRYNALEPAKGESLTALKQKEDSLRDRMIISPKGVDILAASFDPSLSFLISTDTNLYLEYSTPKGNALQVDTIEPNLRLLAHFEKMVR